VGQDIGNVAVNQVCEGVALRLSGREVSACTDGCLCTLDLLAGLRELGEGGREWRCAFASNLGAVDVLAVLPWTLDDGCHGLCLPLDEGDTVGDACVPELHQICTMRQEGRP
jgi:hypothetical protein